jgi:very-short-patch-repair endonuclease
MAGKNAQGRLWATVRRQHGVISRRQLLAFGFSSKAIDHRIRTGRLHRLYAGVYAVGRPEVGELGRAMAAVLACGDGAALSHASAAALWGIRPRRSGVIDVSVPSPRAPRRGGIRVHRRAPPGMEETVVRQGIPVTGPSATIIDIAPGLSRAQLERAINEADRLELVTPERLREFAQERRTPGAGTVRELLGETTFTLTDSELERRFLLIVRGARLPKPRTQAVVNGFKVDFWWPALGLVVETDGLRYHRTPAQQKRDRIRDQRHTAAGLSVLRFTHAQVRYDPDHVIEVLTQVAAYRP